MRCAGFSENSPRRDATPETKNKGNIDAQLIQHSVNVFNFFN